MRRTLLLALPLALALGIAAALAFYSATGSGSASAGVGGLSAPTISSATGGVGTVALAWTTVSPPPPGGSVTYYVKRDGGAAGGNCPAAASPTSATSCTDSGLAAGTTYHYSVTAVWRSWSAASAQATATTTARTITLTPTSGHVGDTVSISGQAFPASSSVSATYNGASVTVTPATSTDGSGSFSGATFVVPASAAGGHTVVVTAGGQTASATFTVTPKITLSATSGNVGDSVTVSGTGFAASSAVTVSYDGSGQTTSPPSPTSGANGSFGPVSFTVPASVKGSHSVAATDGSANSASTSFTVNPKLTLSPNSAQVGDTVTVTGSGFAASSAVTLKFDGTAQTTAPPSPSSNGTGGFSLTFQVPTSVAGSHTVAATDAASNSASAGLTVTPKIVLTSSTGHVGDTVTITGTGFAASATVSSTFGGSAILLSPPIPLTSSTGGFSATFTVPASAAGAYTVTATDSLADSASATFTVTPKITLIGGSVSAASGYVGDTVTISGTGFGANKTISATYDGSAVTIPATTTDGSGNFSGASFTVPGSTAGSHTVTATGSGGNSASATFTVNPKITLTPSTGNQGSSNSISGTGFAASSALSATFNTTSTLTLTGTTATDSTGSFSGANYTAPYIGSGTYAVRVTDASSNNASANYRLRGSIASRTSAAWNVSTTWTGSAKTGTITTSALSTTVTGSGTKFITELQAGDALYLGDGTTLIGTVASITSDTSLSLQANAASTNSGVAYTGGRVPTSLDDVTISTGNAVTIAAGIAAAANSLTIAAGNTSQSLALTASSASLTVTGDVNLTQPTAGAGGQNTQLILDAGTATVGGNVNLNSTLTNTNKCERLRLTTGTLTVSGNLNVNAPNQNGAPACAATGGFGAPGAITQIDMTGGAGTLNLAGALTVANSGTQAAGLASSTTSTIDFNGASAQTIPVPASTKWAYGDIVVANASGATFGAASVAGDILGDITISAGASLSTGSFNQVIAGNFTNNGNFTAGTSTLTFAGSSPETIGGSQATTFSSVTVNSTSTVTLATSGSLAGNLTVSSGTLDLGANTLSGSGGTLTVSNGATLAVGGTNGFPSGYGTQTLGASSTVNYEGAGQAVAGLTYGNLTTSGSGTKTAAAGLTVSGSLTIGSGTTFAASSFSHSLQGNVTNNGTFSAGTSTVTLNGSGAQTLGGSSTTTFNNLVDSNSSFAPALNFNVSGTFTISGGVTYTPSAAIVINSGGAQGTITGSGTTVVTRTAATADFSSQYAFSTNTLANLTVNYGASAAQTISALTYGNLTTSGSGTKTVAGGLTIGGNLTIGSGTTFAATGFSHTIAGNFTNNGTYTAGNGLTFNGTNPQTIGGSSTTTFNNLTINSSSTVSLAASQSVAGNLTVTAGTLDLSTFTLNRTSTGGTLTVSSGTTLRLGGSSNFPTNYTTVSLAGSTVEYYASSAQTVTATTYGNLLLTGSATKTAGGALTVAGNLTIGSGATFAGSTFAHSVAGNWSNSGTFTAGTSTVTLNGSSGQTLTGATTFNNLTLNNGAGFTLANNETVGGALTLTSGIVATGASTLIVSTGGTVSRTSGYINGTEQRGFNAGAGQSATFDVGTASTYAPINVASLGVTTGGTLTASSTGAQQPNYATSGLSQTQYVKRYWKLTPGGGLVVSGYNATATFVAGDLVGAPTTANLAVSRFSGGTWTEPTTWSATSTTATGTGFGTGFGDFVAGIPVATQLAFTTQPAGAVPGVAFTTQPQVTVEDAQGHVVPSDSSTVTLSITTSTPTSGGPGTLSGCSQSETSGVITFSGCKISAVGVGYKLHAVDGSLTAADSSAFNVSMAVSSVATITDTAHVASDTTSSFNLQPNAVYVVHVYRHSSAGDSVTGISTSGFVGASALTAIAPTGAVPTTGQNWNSSDYQWAWYFTTGASPSGTGTVTVNFTNSLVGGQVTVIDVTEILGANTSSPLAQASSTATGNSTTATGNLGGAVVSTFDTKLVLFGEQKNTTPSSVNLANLFVSSQNSGTGATLWATNPLVQNDNITVTSGQWATVTLEIAHA